MQGKGAPLPLQPIPKTNNNTKNKTKTKNNTKTKTKTKTNYKIKVVYTEDLTHPRPSIAAPLAHAPTRHSARDAALPLSRSWPTPTRVDLRSVNSEVTEWARFSRALHYPVKSSLRTSAPT